MNFKEKLHDNKVNFGKNNNINELAKREFQTISYSLPFKNQTKFVPDFLKGKSRGLFAISKK